MGDIDRTYYRSKEEEQEWKSQRDPLKLLADWLIDQGLCEQSALDQIHEEAEVEIEAGSDFAIKAPYPDVSEVDQHVYA